MKDLFIANLAKLGLGFDENIIDLILSYWALLLEKNRVMNLISPKQDPATQVSVHLVDSLTPLLLPEMSKDMYAGADFKVLDIGSGGGLPAIPLSIARPLWFFTLAEATGKKESFLQEVKERLALANLAVFNQYLEPGDRPGGFDLVTARAVSQLDKLAVLAAPRLKIGGLFLAMKGPRAIEEIRESGPLLKRLKLELISQKSLVLPDLEASRMLLLFRRQ